MLFVVCVWQFNPHRLISLSSSIHHPVLQDRDSIPESNRLPDTSTYVVPKAATTANFCNVFPISTPYSMSTTTATSAANLAALANASVSPLAPVVAPVALGLEYERDASHVKKCAPFVQKIYGMVSEPEIDAVVTWTAEGNSFVVLDTQAMQDVILPRYFKVSESRVGVCTCTYVRDLLTRNEGSQPP